MLPTFIGSEAGTAQRSIPAQCSATAQYSATGGNRVSLVIDPEAFRVTLDGAEVSLTRTEFDLLTC